MVLTYNYDNSRPGKGETVFRELYEVNLTGCAGKLEAH